MLFGDVEKLILGNVFLRNEIVAAHARVYLKIEAFNPAGSIKIKPALLMIKKLEEAGLISRDCHLIESSSGNIGLALSLVCATRGYKFTCVSDPNISSHTAGLIRAYGAELIIVTERDENGGYLGSRIKLINSMLSTQENLIWLNQYENHANVESHYTTADEILQQFKFVDYVFVGAGTTGTLGGVSAHMKTHSPNTKIIAVDTVGSVTFNNPPGKRFIPGLGTSKPPLIRKYSSYDELLIIPEIDTVRMCHKLAQRGLLLGGSSGTVLCGIEKYSQCINANQIVIAICPDMGDRYVDTIYNQDWVRDKFPCYTTYT